MQMEPTSTLTVQQILDLRQNKMLTVNPEYQRGPVWSSAMKKKLIDSVLRCYPIPLIYFHHIKTSVAGMQREDLEVIDGQQRINSLYEFKEGALKLFDPIKDDKEARFPNFIKNIPCPWAGCTFDSLTPELKSRFLSTDLFVVKISTSSPHEARDLFIRLQAGLPLNAQEKRDAWPGGFTEFVLKFGGKPEIVRYQGHNFFRRFIQGAARGKARQLCAQIAMLFLEKRRDGNWTDIGTRALDDYYYKNLDFDISSPDVKRFGEVLDQIVRILGDGKRRRLKAHEAIHLFLLVDSLLDDYTRSWQDRFAAAFDQFMDAVAKDKATRHDPNPGPFWTNYDARTRTDSDRAETIRLRHRFFSEKMHTFLSPLQLKDPNRLYGEVERQIIYWRDQKRCAVCGGEIGWSELEIHHLKQHTDGGPTTLDNGRAVHRFCHPKGAAASAFQPLPIEPTSPSELPRGEDEATSGSPKYIENYRKLLKNPDTLPSRIKQYIDQVGSINWRELKKICVEKLGCESEASGSIGASLKVLELDGYVTITGWGEDKKIRSNLRN